MPPFTFKGGQSIQATCLAKLAQSIDETGLTRTCREEILKYGPRMITNGDVDRIRRTAAPKKPYRPRGAFRAPQDASGLSRHEFQILMSSWIKRVCSHKHDQTAE